MRWSYLLVTVALLFFLVYKLLRFEALGYSFNDMYAFVQMSCSWMDGRPFMYDNIWGYHHRIHNYYTVLFWGPLCYYFGAKALFWVQAILLLLAYWIVNQQLIRVKVPTWARITLLVTILLGPVSFWLNDHPNIGWHSELTFFPAALFWAVSISRNNVIGQVFAGLFLALVREDGAVLALLIHGSAVALTYLQSSERWQGTRSTVQLLLDLLRRPKLWLVVGGWSVMFVAGMVWLAVKNNEPDPRLRNALNLMITNAGNWSFWQQMLILLGQAMLLLVPVAIVLALLIRRVESRRKAAIWIVWVVGVLLLIVLMIVQSAHYIGQPLFYLVSLTWPPRFVLVWGFSVAFLVLFASRFAARIQPHSVAFNQQLVWSLSRRNWFWIALLWLIQVPILHLSRPDIPGWREWKAAFWGPPGANMNPLFLDPDDLVTIRRIADNLPPRSNVFAFDHVVPYFHKHYGIWPTGKQWQTADVAVMSRPDFQNLRPWLKTLLPGPVDSVQLKHYTVYYRPPFASVVEKSLRK